MTTATQFSLEEENFYKDIQDLVKKGSQNEKELSTVRVLLGNISN